MHFEARGFSPVMPHKEYQMSQTEKILATGLGAIILGAIVALAFANSLASNLFAIYTVIVLCLMAGLLWTQTQRTEKPTVEVHYAKPEDGVWPPPPTTKPGTVAPDVFSAEKRTRG